MSEVWKDIEGFEGLYKISSFGRIKSLTRTVGYRIKGRTKILKGKHIKPTLGSRGYVRVCLCKNGTKNYILLHRLVANHFIHNPENKPQINHKDGIKINNRIENLEWSTCSENIIHAFETNLRATPRKPILQFDLNGNFIKEWSGAIEIITTLGISHKCFYNWLDGNQQTSGGFIWKRKSELQKAS